MPKPELKRAEYVDANGRTGEVLYAIIGFHCVFCGVTPETQSTINAAERILRAIGAAEGRPVHGMRIYDLQTRSSYPYKKPGEFAFNRLQLTPNYDTDSYDIDWIPEHCPEQIRDLFAEQIG